VAQVAVPSGQIVILVRAVKYPKVSLRSSPTSARVNLPR